MPKEDQPYEYKAFISYSHRDEKWGHWLHRGIEGYKIPKGLIGRDTRYGPVPKRLFPVFRDREELPTASDLSKIINQALIDSSHLIVICSPNSAKSQWVNEEVKAFKKLGKQNRILCLIVDGEPNAANKPELGLEECFPPAVKVAADEDGNLTEIEAEPIAADAREGKDGKANALMKVFAGMLGVGFDEIKQRDLARKQKRAALVGTASLVLALVMGLLTVWAIGNKNVAVTAKEDSDKQRLLAEQAKDEAERLLYNAKIFQANYFDKENSYAQAKKALLEAPEKYRNFEWGYLIRKLNPQLTTVFDGEIALGFFDSAFSPDGKRIATVSKEATTRILDVATGEQVAFFEAIFLGAFSPDGKHVVTSLLDYTVKIFDTETGGEVALLKGHSDGVLSASYSQDGKRIATSSKDKTLRIWDTTTREQLAIHELEKECQILSYSPDGKRIVVYSISDGVIEVRDAMTGEKVFVIGDPVIGHVFAFNPDGKRIAISSRSRFMAEPSNNSITIFDAETGHEFKVIENHLPDHQIQSFSYSPDGKLFVVSSKDKTLRIWDAETGEQISVLKATLDRFWQVLLSPDGKRIATVSDDGILRIWDATAAGRVAFDGHFAGADHITIWDAMADEKVAVIEGKHFVYSHHGKLFVISWKGEVATIWDTATGESVAVLKGHTGKIHHAAYSPNGKRIATTSQDKTLRIWDAVTGEQVSVLHEGHLLGLVAYSPNGKQIATSSGDSSINIRIWDAETGDQVAVIDGPDLGAVIFAYSPDGKRIATTSMTSHEGHLAGNTLERKIKFWDATTGGQVGAIAFSSSVLASGLSHLAYSPDGKCIAISFDNKIKIWDAMTGEQVHVIEEANMDFMFAYSPDGKRIATTRRSSDFSASPITIWDTTVGEQVASIEANSRYSDVVAEMPYAMSFSSDGRRVMVAYTKNLIGLWEVAPLKDEDYPGDASMPFMQRYNLWSLQQHVKRKKAEQNRLGRIGRIKTADPQNKTKIFESGTYTLGSKYHADQRFTDHFWVHEKEWAKNPFGIGHKVVNGDAVYTINHFIADDGEDVLTGEALVFINMHGNMNRTLAVGDKVMISVDDNLLINTLQAEEELNQLKQFQTVEKTGYTIRMRILTNMTPANALISLRHEQNAFECGKLLYLMQVPERKTIISELNNGSDKDKRLAADILKRIEHIKNAIPQKRTDTSTGKQTAK